LKTQLQKGNQFWIGHSSDEGTDANNVIQGSDNQWSDLGLNPPVNEIDMADTSQAEIVHAYMNKFSSTFSSDFDGIRDSVAIAFDTNPESVDLQGYRIKTTWHPSSPRPRILMTRTVARLGKPETNHKLLISQEEIRHNFQLRPQNFPFQRDLRKRHWGLVEYAECGVQ